MSSGRQLGERNVAVFGAWVASKTDNDFRAMAKRGVLSRKDVAIECGFAKSTLDQNPRIKAALRTLEDDLRTRGVLPPFVETTTEVEGNSLIRKPGKLRGALDAERLSPLVTENACLKAEVAELKRSLQKHAFLSEALALTGRLPR